MASCSTLKASSSASNCDAYNYHVFISFRGADTRNNFTDHLYHALVAYGIHTFRDEEELEKGGHIASNLWRAIEESKIFIIIFSENYATSKWCLNELVKIIEYTTPDQDKKVMPVFYHVEPRDVRNQGGSFEKAFLEHAKDADQEKEKTIETWKEALKTAGELKGYDVKNESEVELIQRIREDIITRLNRKTLDLGDNIVGMDFHLEQLKSLIKTELDEVHMIGIYGTGGIGKTTIAMAIYNDISSQFDGSSFLKNIGGKGEDGLLKLQKTLLRDILKGEMPKFSNTSEGINVIKDRLRWKRVLIVLDDVDQYEQLETLAGKYGWYGAKSIVIITTKDIHLLKRHGVKKHYEVQKLNLEKSTKLFNWWAFQQSTPKPEFESLSNSVLKYVDGLPIALKVLGGFLFDRSINEWNSFMHKLQEMPNRTIQSVLKVSYDKLDSSEQSIFLDIACFFRGEDKDFVLRILGSCAEIGIQVLNDRCLITISENKLDMHDLLQRMGQEIIREEYPQEPGKRTRLWNLNDVNSVLTKNKGTQTIEGLFVEVSTSNRIQFSKDSFTNMNRLRLLKVYNQRFWENYEVDLPKDLEFPSFELKYFHFERYPLESLPANFHAKNLVELNLMESSIKQLWKENEILDNLKVINLSYSEDLVEIPCFSSVPNLEILILEGCFRLTRFPEIKGNMRKLRKIDLSATAIVEVPSSIEHLSGLEYFNLSSCNGLVNLPESICNLSFLKTLVVVWCSNLKGFPEIKDDMENLQMLNLSDTAIEELSSSIEHLKALKHLFLSGCKSLGSLPESICNLSSLETLETERCFELKGFPEIKDDMKNLQMLNLSETAIEELPSSIGHLKALKHLYLSGCKSLGSLPESTCNLSSLETLDAGGCFELEGFPEIKDDMENLQILNLRATAIEELPSSIGHLKALKHLYLSGCKSLWSLPESICNLSSLETLEAEGCSELKGFPEIKDDMENLQMLNLSETAIEELPSSIEHLKALKKLNLSGCKSLGSLPESICNLSSLETLVVRDCPKLVRLEVNLEGSPDLTCCILKPGVIWNNDHFSSLKTLNLQCNQMEAEVLNHHIFSLSSLVELSTRNSDLREDEILSASFHPSTVDVLSVANFNPMARGILSDIFHQSSLKRLSLDNCNLMEEGIPTNIWNLPSLVQLSLSNCSLKDGDILNHICHLSSLEELSLDGNHFSSIPAGISRLSNLSGLNLSHCKKLQEIPELPSTLRGLNLSHCKKLQDIPKLPSSLLFLDAHCSDGISSSPSLLSSNSLFNRFKSELIQETGISVGASRFKGKGTSIVIPRSSGIVEGIRNQSRGSEVTIELPQNWYQNDDLLGFALCCVLDDEYYCGYDLKCELTIERNYPSNKLDDFRIYCRCHVCDDDHRVSDYAWVIYYPKDAIKEQYRSNQWTHFKASFHGYGTVKVEECGIHLIYASCFKCQRLEECQQKLCLKGHDIHELPFIDRPFELDSLCLRECKSLESLPSTICELKSLTILSCSGCSQLKIFPEILEVLENLRELHLDGTAIEELPSSIQHIRGLQYLNLAYCNNLVSLPETIFHLKSLVFLSCRGCSQLKSFPEILENMENLRGLNLAGTAIKELPSSIEHLPGLQDLGLSTCNNLVNLPESICNLRFLKYLNVNSCSKLEKFPQNLKNLQCLEGLGVAGFDSSRVQGAIQSDFCYISSGEASNRCINYFSSIPVNIIQLSKLRILHLSHCQKLLQIPELPPSLRILDVHACPCLETLSSPSSLLGFSLFRCFKSAIEEFECESSRTPEFTAIIAGNKGIPEWISQQQKGSQIIVELPMDWHQNKYFLGFALYSLYVPLHIESKEDQCSLTCELNFHCHQFEFLDDLLSNLWPAGKFSLRHRYPCCHNGGESNRLWVVYYPKVAIPNQYWSNEWRHLKASFHGKQAKVEECGFHLIYMPNILNTDSNTHGKSSFGTNHLLRKNNGFNAKRSHDDAEDHQKEDPHPKRSRHL